MALAQGKRVRLTPFSPAHITEAYLSWLNDRSLMRYSRQRMRTHTRESSLRYLASFTDSPSHFLAVERVDGELVGTLSLHVDTDHRTGELAMMIGHPQAVGTGCGGEAWGLALQYGFETLRLRKLTGGTVAPNERMLRILRRWGMHQEGLQREQEVLDDGPADVLLFGLLAAEWEALRR